MSQDFKDYVDVIAKILGVGGGLLAAYKGIDEFRQSRKINERDLRWKQANAAKDIIDEMFDDPKAKSASLMLDWEEREYEIDGNKESIERKEVIWALRNHHLEVITDKETFIRDCFDYFLYYTELIEQSINNQLFEQKDIEFPLRYYANILKKPGIQPAFSNYLDTYGYRNSVQFFARFN